MRERVDSFLIFYNFLVKVFSRTPVGPTIPEAPKKVEVVESRATESSKFKKGKRGREEKAEKGFGKSAYSKPLHAGSDRGGSGTADRTVPVYRRIQSSNLNWRYRSRGLLLLPSQ